MEYDSEILKAVRGLGALGYDIEKVIETVKPFNSITFRIDLEDEEHPLHVMYESGLNANGSELDRLNALLIGIQIESEKIDLQQKKNTEEMINEYLGNGDSE